MEDKPNYYSIIPATVRYDKELKANEKLLYGEITSLCNDKGYCWASNKYFSELYNVSTRSITEWVSNLESKNYISIRYDKDNKRYISILDTLWKKTSRPIEENFYTPIEENFYHNNININNKNNNITIYDYYEDKIGQLSPNQYELFNNLIDKVGEQKVKDSIDKAIGTGKKVSLNYIISIANNKSYKNNPKEMLIPEWMTREQTRDTMTDEELEEFKKELNWDETFK